MIVPVCDQCNGRIIPESLQRWPYVPLHVSTKSILCEDGNSCESIHGMRIEDDRQD